MTVFIPLMAAQGYSRHTLEFIVQFSPPDSYREFVSIENGSREGAENEVADLPERLNARYTHRERGNKSYALNEALETIKDGLVVFFDDDVRVDPGTLVAYSEAASDHDGGVFFGGPVEVDREEDPPEWLNPFFPSSALGFDLVSSRPSQNKYIGFNWAAYTKDIKEVGGFDPRLGPGALSGTAVGDESDLQQRMMKNGVHPIAVSQAVVTHHVPAEHTTLRWLLQRKYYVGIFAGITTSRQDRDWISLIKGMIQSVALLLKGSILADKEKMVIALLSIYQGSGKAKGYWSTNSEVKWD